MHELKEVSKAKHRILSSYFPTWASILGQYPSLVYVDCFAGAGKYNENEPGSPLIIFKLAKDLIKANRAKKLLLIFIEKNKKNAETLQNILDATPDSNENISYYVYPEDAEDITDKLLDAIPKNWPAFFFIDPYGHPISFPIIKKILEHPRREVLLNLMWFSINRDLNNPREKEPLNKMFGNSSWQEQSFIAETGDVREDHFLKFVESEIGAKFPIHFKILFGPDDNVRGYNRTKYYLIHFSNHEKAALVMKQIMHKLGDEEGTFDYSASKQGVLFTRTPQISQLKEYLVSNYCGKGIKISFLQLQIDTISDLPFIEKHYRAAIKEMEGNELEIKRVKSKRSGIADEDIIIFK